MVVTGTTRALISARLLERLVVTVVTAAPVACMATVVTAVLAATARRAATVQMA
jgi:hypothetical protein